MARLTRAADHSKLSLAAAALLSLTRGPKGRRAAFETAIRLPRRESYVAVRALDSHGHTLGTSATVRG